jgi:hypothetical protein
MTTPRKGHGDVTAGQVKVRLSGGSAALGAAIALLAAAARAGGARLAGQPASYPNRRDPGSRAYLTLVMPGPPEGELADRDCGGLAGLADLIACQVAAWHDFGYPDPPPGCKAIPPPGQRSAAAISSGHDAIGTIDELTRKLHALRAQLAGELRQDSGHHRPAGRKEPRPPGSVS